MEELMKNDYELILTVVNRGFADKVMESARNVGATGGTIIHGRGTASNDDKFLNINIVVEKEVVLIAVRKELKKDIMEAILNCSKENGEAQGITFTLPVDDLVGFKNIENL